MQAATPPGEWRPRLECVLEEDGGRESVAEAPRPSLATAGEDCQPQDHCPPRWAANVCRRKRGNRGASYALLASLALFFASGLFVALGAYLTIMADLHHKRGRFIINASWFHTREEWNAHEPDDKVELNTPAKYVILIEMQPQYYCNNFNTCSNILQYLQEYHTTHCGLSDIAYNYLLSGGAVGEVYEGRGAHIQGQHTDGFNSRSLGIGLMDDYTSDNDTVIKKRIEYFAQFLQYAVQEGYLETDYYLLGQKNITLAQNISQSSDS